MLWECCCPISWFSAFSTLESLGSWPLAVLSLAPHFTELLDAAEESLDFSFFRLPHPFYGFTPQKYTISVFCLIEEYSQ